MTNTELITIIFSIIAIIISIITYRQNFKVQKRQLRIEKLEEILEITHILNGNYQYYEDTFTFKMAIIDDFEENEESEKYANVVHSLIKLSEEIDLRNKLSRLYVLNNSYLPKRKLKDKIGVFIALYTSVAENTIISPNKKIDIVFNKFPKKWEFLDFTNEIQNEIIKEMDLGYKNNINYDNNFESEFKKRYNL